MPAAFAELAVAVGGTGLALGPRPSAVNLINQEISSWNLEKGALFSVHRTRDYSSGQDEDFCEYIFTNISFLKF